MSEELQTKQIIEGLLLAAGKPLPLNKIAEVFSDKERPETETLKAVLKEIGDECEHRGFELKQVSSGYRFQVKQEYGEWVGRLWDEKPQRYSRALLETISIIAYRQPITRGEIEKIRGVAVSSGIIRTLMDRDWVRVVGHRDVPGRPAMYATTRSFLDYFNLKSLEELPPLAEIRDMEEFDQKLSLDEDAPESRVLEFPSAEDMVDVFDVPDEEEEAAAAIGTRPINEILGIVEEEEPAEDEFDDDFDLEATSGVADAVDASAGDATVESEPISDDNAEAGIEESNSSAGGQDEHDLTAVSEADDADTGEDLSDDPGAPGADDEIGEDEQPPQ